MEDKVRRHSRSCLVAAHACLLSLQRQLQAICSTRGGRGALQKYYWGRGSCRSSSRGSNIDRAG